MADKPSEAYARILELVKSTLSANAHAANLTPPTPAHYRGSEGFIVSQASHHRAVQRLIESGVILHRPDSCVIDDEVEVAPGALIEPYVQLLGKTKIGAGTRIRSFTVIENCSLGENVLVRQNCVLADSTVADGAKIGPFAHIRPESEIGPEAHIGNFVEIKKSRIARGAKANHLAYIGDAEVGEAANIGAGTITCNYDGVHKHQTKIGKSAFIGSNSTLVAPLTIGDGAYIGAASCIPKDVPADALAVARVKPIVKEGWAAARRAARRIGSSHA